MHYPKCLSSFSGDIVTHINDCPIHGSTDVYKHLEGKEDLKMKLFRKDRFLNITISPEMAGKESM